MAKFAWEPSPVAEERVDLKPRQGGDLGDSGKGQEAGCAVLPRGAWWVLVPQTDAERTVLKVRRREFCVWVRDGGVCPVSSGMSNMKPREVRTGSGDWTRHHQWWSQTMECS